MQRVVVLRAEELGAQSELCIGPAATPLIVALEGGVSRAAPSIGKASGGLHRGQLVLILQQVGAHGRAAIATRFLAVLALERCRLLLLRFGRLLYLNLVSASAHIALGQLLLDLMLVLLENALHRSLSVVLRGDLLAELAAL